jgi:hypothetical protein
MNAERRPIKDRSMLFYTVGRSYLLELYHSDLQSGQVSIVDGPATRRAYEQLMALETEIRESGTIYRCPTGQHDDLGISCAMLAWAARHSHLRFWANNVPSARTPRWARPRLVRKPGHKHLSFTMCRLSLGLSKFSRAVWRGFEYFFKQ